MYIKDPTQSGEIVVKELQQVAQLNTLSEIRQVFKPELFKQNAQLVVDILTRYLSDDSIKGLAMTNPAELVAQAKALMASNQDDKQTLSEIIELYIKTGIQVHSPGYMGRQFSGVIPLAGIFDLVNSIINQPSSFYEAAQLPNVVESIMAQEFNRYIGYPDNNFAMVTTQGASLGNLTAILAARNNKIDDCWQQGLSARQGLRPAIAVSEDVHYSVTRAAGILGIGAAQLVKLPVDECKRICLERAPEILDKAKDEGLQIFCLVASGGSTSVGAFDPIEGLVDICSNRDIWLHVDCAHGGSLLLSEERKELLKGLEKADSFVWDAHKMLFVPSMCTLLFYKNKQASEGAFAQQASYVFDKEPNIYTEYDSATRNFECTKRPMIMGLWVCWVIYGPKLFAQKVEHLCDMTQKACDRLAQISDYTVLHQPQSNILCFRYEPTSLPESQLASLQLHIRDQLREGGRFFISKVDIDGVTALRVVFMNHEIELAHFELLLDEIRALSADWLQTTEPEIAGVSWPQ